MANRECGVLDPRPTVRKASSVPAVLPLARPALCLARLCDASKASTVHVHDSDTTEGTPTTRRKANAIEMAPRGLIRCKQTAERKQKLYPWLASAAEVSAAPDSVGARREGTVFGDSTRAR